MSGKAVFSYEFVSVLVMTNATIKETLSNLGGVAPTDYSILQKLLILNRPVGLDEYYDFLLLKKNTVSTAVSRLESAGYVVKELDKGDLRKCRVSITDKGAAFAHEASVAIREALLSEFWMTFDDEHVNWGMVVDSRAYLASDVASKEAETALQSEDFVIPSWVMALRYLEQLCTETLRARASLSLSEFRVLDLINVKGERLSSAEISRMLRLEKSSVSRVTRSLRESGLISMKRSSLDKRSFGSLPTPEGEARLALARERLEDLVDKHYECLSAEERDSLAAWHRRMLENFLNR